MIKAIIFDIGGVILDLKPLINHFVNIFKPKDVKKFWNIINIEVIPLCKNQIYEKEFWKKIANYYKINPKKVPGDLWTKDFDKLTQINNEVLDIVKSLKTKYKLGLISNMIPAHFNVIKKSGIFNYFDVIVLSYKVGLTKDQKEMFLTIANKLKVNPKECLLIDDIKQFIDVAQSVGMKAILFKDPKRLKADLSRLLN